MIGEVEDDETEDNAAEGAQDVRRVAEEIEVNAIEHVPNTTPDKNEPDDRGEVVAEVAQDVTVPMMPHRMIKILVHEKIISRTF